MKILVDENLPHQIATALAALDQPVVSVASLGLNGKDDIEVFRAARRHGVTAILTRDYKIGRRQAEIDEARRLQLGLFFVRGAKLSMFDLAVLIVTRWKDVVSTREHEPVPFERMLGRTGVRTVGRGDR